MAINYLGRASVTISGNSNSGVSGRASGAEQTPDSLVVEERNRQERGSRPGLLTIDSQTVKIRQFIEEEPGIDANKIINGRKCSIAVDRLDSRWSLAITSANTSDNEAGRLVVDQPKAKVPRSEVIAADYDYKVSFIDHVKNEYGWRVEIAQKPESSPGFVPMKNGTGRPALARSTRFWMAQF